MPKTEPFTSLAPSDPSKASSAALAFVESYLEEDGWLNGHGGDIDGERADLMFFVSDGNKNAAKYCNELAPFVTPLVKNVKYTLSVGRDGFDDAKLAWEHDCAEPAS